MKVITICWSLKFKNEMMKVAEQLALGGNCVITPVYPTEDNYTRTAEQIENLKNAHFKKIDLSDAIYVINVNGYIGKSTKLEIEYAKSNKKEILYLENWNF